MSMECSYIDLGRAFKETVYFLEDRFGEAILERKLAVDGAEITFTAKPCVAVPMREKPNESPRRNMAEKPEYRIHMDAEIRISDEMKQKDDAALKLAVREALVELGEELDGLMNADQKALPVRFTAKVFGKDHRTDLCRSNGDQALAVHAAKSVSFAIDRQIDRMMQNRLSFWGNVQRELGAIRASMPRVSFA
ncbi:MAG: hypothetical protein GC136_09290 [Alphaproteobacteria bacterium]|nr:hypothetical protein [Alphaproteobacteria bacterium]